MLLSAPAVRGAGVGSIYHCLTFLIGGRAEGCCRGEDQVTLTLPHTDQGPAGIRGGPPDRLDTWILPTVREQDSKIHSLISAHIDSK